MKMPPYRVDSFAGPVFGLTPRRYLSRTSFLESTQPSTSTRTK